MGANRVGLVFGVTRVLATPNAQDGGYCVARIPVKVDLLFSQNIVEVSFPEFSEPVHDHLAAAEHSQFPSRAFHLVDQVFRTLEHDRWLPDGYGTQKISGSRVLLHLERNYEGDDHGWDIERPDGAELDTKQSKRLPLKSILTEFQGELARKCVERGKKNPLAKSDLYALFRTIKSESHTASMVLSVPLGRRQGKIELTAFLGRQSEHRDPIFRVLSAGYTYDALEGFRKAVAECQNPDLKLEDRYSIDALDNL